MGRVGSSPEFHINVGSGWVTSLVGRVGWVGSRKLDQRPTLYQADTATCSEIKTVSRSAAVALFE